MMLEDPPRPVFTTHLAQSCSALTILIGGVGMMGWLSGSATLKSVLPGLVRMKWNTAVGLSLAGFSLLLLLRAESGWRPRLARLCALCTALIGLLTLSEYILGWDLRVDQLLFRDIPDSINPYPGRPGPNTAFCLLLTGASLLMHRVRVRRLWPAELLALGVLVVAFTALVGYIYSAAALYRIASFTGMALNTAIAFIVLSLGLLTSHREYSVAGLLADKGPGGVMLRRLLPASLIVLLMLGYFRVQGQNAGYVDTAFGTALHSTVGTIIIGLLIWWNARAIQRLEQEREHIAANARVAERQSSHLAAIVESSDDAIISNDLNGMITSWNKGAEKLFGYTAEEVIGKSITILFPPDRMDEEARVMGCIRRGEKISHYETVRLRKDGSLMEISLTVSPLRNEAGEIIGASKISRNITEQKRAEKALIESEERFAKAFNASPIVLTISSLRTGKLIEVNDTFVKTTGFSREEAIGQTTLELGLWKRPEDREAELGVVRQRGQVRDQEYQFQTKSGRELTGLLSAERIELDGEPVALTVIRDITEEKRLMERERTLRLQAEEANRLKDEFLSTVSHELRTPLNHMLGWIVMMRGGRLTPQQTDDALETIERNARAQNRLIEDLLDVSRIITGKLQIELRPVEIVNVLHSAVTSARPAANARGIELRLETESKNSLVVLGDPDRLQQIAWNLVSNAIKFTPEGGRVQIRLDRVDTHVEIAVADNGLGINPEFLPYVFDRFRQEDGGVSRQFGGLGLGLAIVRHLVELHGGTVQADSAGLGQGATFTVSLPVASGRLPSPRTKLTEQPVSAYEEER